MLLENQEMKSVCQKIGFKLEEDMEEGVIRGELLL
jgi:hypothetical protein